MKKSGFFLHLTIAAIMLLTTIPSCTFPPKPAQYTEFYVSVKGSDSTGKGTNSGTRNAPSQLVFFSLRNGVVAPSGQVLTCGPLSVE